jgi:Ni,Fe-hydrogenase III small subunit
MSAIRYPAASDPEASPASLLALLDRDHPTNRRLARHPRASAELLEKLSHSSDRATRQAVASNPNTPPQIYVRLGQQFPKAFLANPALDLLLMVSPDLIAQAPQAFLIRLLKQADCPPSLLVWAAEHSQAKVQLAVAMNANAPEQALEKLQASKHASVLETIRSRGGFGLVQDPEKAFEQAVIDLLDSLPTESLYWAWRGGQIGLAQWSALPLRFRLAMACMDRELPAAVIAIMLRRTTWTFEQLNKVLRNYPWSYLTGVPDEPVPMEVLDVMAKDSEQGVRRDVACHPFASVEVLEELSADSEAWVRTGVASNPSVSLEVLDALAKDAETSVRKAVARNPSTRVPVLEVLAVDKESSVRWEVAGNPSAPFRLLELLARDTGSSVRAQVAENSNSPVPVLDMLAQDSEIAVRKAVAENPSTSKATLEVLAKDAEWSIRKSVARNRSAPSAALEVLGRDFDIWIRADVAGNPSTPLAVLESLARDAESHVRKKVARNPSTPVLALQCLSEDTETSVRNETAGNPSTPSLALDTLAKDTEKDVRRTVGSNLSTPSLTLELLAKDAETSVRIEVCGNPSTPVSVLVSLAKGRAVTVRYAVAAKQSHRSEQLCRSLWSDTRKNARLALASNHQVSPDLLDEFARGAEREVEIVVLLGNKNLKESTAQFLADKLLTTEATASPWYLQELSKASPEVAQAARERRVLSYFGRDPNKAVLATLPLPQVMALSSGPFVEPSRIVRLAGSTNWLVRAAVARNRGTPENLLKKLSADVHPLVASLAFDTQRYLTEPPPGEESSPVLNLDLERTASEIVKRARKLGQTEPESLSNWVMDDVWGDLVSIDEVLAILSQRQPLIDFFPSILEQLDAEQVSLLFENGSNSNYAVVRKLLAQNCECPVGVLQALAGDDEPTVLLAVLGNKLFPRTEHVRILKAMRKIVRKGRRGRGREKLWEFWKLLKERSNAPEVLEAVASLASRIVIPNPSTPVSLLESYANRSDAWVRGLVAKNPSASPQLLQMLAKDSDELVRRGVAGNPSAPTCLLEVFATDPDEMVRQDVAENSSTPPEALDWLAKDPAVAVRKKVASNPSASDAVLTSLAVDPDDSIQAQVACNPSSPNAVLMSLARSAVKDVRKEVAGNPSTPASVLTSLSADSANDVREQVAANSSTPVTVLESLSMDSADTVRERVASNPSTPMSVLKELANDEWIRRNVVGNPSTPTFVLEALRKHWDVRSEAALNIAARLSQGYWAKRVKNAIKRELSVTAQESCEPEVPLLTDDLLRGLEWLWLVSPEDDNKSLTKASRSTDWLTRLGVALHPSASEGILKLLRKDSDPDVARAAHRPPDIGDIRAA